MILISGCLGTTRLLGASTVVKKDGALFGPPNEKYNLRKTLDTSKSVKQKADSWTGYTDKRKDPTPTVDDKPIIGIRSNKNFIVANAVETILQGESYAYFLFDKIMMCFYSAKANQVK